MKRYTVRTTAVDPEARPCQWDGDPDTVTCGVMTENRYFYSADPPERREKFFICLGHVKELGTGWERDREAVQGQ